MFFLCWKGERMVPCRVCWGYCNHHNKWHVLSNSSWDIRAILVLMNVKIQFCPMPSNSCNSYVCSHSLYSTLESFCQWVFFRILGQTCCHRLPFISNTYFQLGNFTGLFQICNWFPLLWFCRSLATLLLIEHFGNMLKNSSLEVKYATAVCWCVCHIGEILLSI